MILDAVADRFPFWTTAILLVLGLYGMMGKRSLVKKIIGLNIFQSAIILFFISQSMKAGSSTITWEAGPRPWVLNTWWTGWRLSRLPYCCV